MAAAAEGPATAATEAASRAPPATGDTGKHIRAFETQLVISDERVLCVAGWDGQLLAGCSDGTLLLVKQRTQQQGEPGGIDDVDSRSDRCSEGGDSTPKVSGSLRCCHPMGGVALRRTPCTACWLVWHWLALAAPAKAKPPQPIADSPHHRIVTAL